MVPKTLTRRELLKLAAATGAAGLTGSMLPGCGGHPGMPPVPGTSTCAKITDVEHVVILIQENRSFDHYFGTYRGVDGFGWRPRGGGLGSFSQAWAANRSSAPVGRLLPFHLDTVHTSAECTNDLSHDWGPQHQ